MMADFAVSHNASPLPWKSDGYRLMDAHGRTLAADLGGDDSFSRLDDDDMAFIVTAVNVHDEAIEACRHIVEFHRSVFVGRPLSIDGSPVDHTHLNKAAHLAALAIAKAEAS